MTSASRAAVGVSALLLTLAAPLAAQPATTCVPVAARALGRGHVLGADDIATRGNSAFCAQRQGLVGSVTRRVVSAGEVLREPAVAPPNVIESGQPVTVVYQDGGVRLRVQGVAANAAPAGGRVTVRVDVRRRLEGTAESPGVVRVR